MANFGYFVSNAKQPKMAALKDKNQGDNVGNKSWIVVYVSCIYEVLKQSYICSTQLKKLLAEDLIFEL